MHPKAFPASITKVMRPNPISHTPTLTNTVLTECRPISKCVGVSNLAVLSPIVSAMQPKDPVISIVYASIVITMMIQ